MKPLLTLTLFLLSGCARFTTQQVERRYNSEGKITTEITTTVGASTLFDADSKLTNFKATQTEKSQGASVGTLDSSSSGTNAVEVLDRLYKIVNALPK